MHRTVIDFFRRCDLALIVKTLNDDFKVSEVSISNEVSNKTNHENRPKKFEDEE